MPLCARVYQGFDSMKAAAISAARPGFESTGHGDLATRQLQQAALSPVSASDKDRLFPRESWEAVRAEKKMHFLRIRQVLQNAIHAIYDCGNVIRMIVKWSTR